MSKTVGFLLLGGGGLWVAYELGWLCPFGIGPACPATGAAPATTPISPAAGPAPTAAPTTTPSAPAPGTVSFSLAGPVAPDINNSVKGLVSIGGASAVALNCIPPGTIWQGNTDITAQLISRGVDVNGLCSAMQAALTTQQAVAASTTTSTLPKLPPVNWVGSPVFYRPVGPTYRPLPTTISRLPQQPTALSGLGAATPLNYVRKSRFM